MTRANSKKSTRRARKTVYEERQNPATRLRMTMVRDAFADTINRVVYRGERILLERRGKVVAAIVPAADLDLLERMEDQLDLEAARAALADVKKHGTVPWEEVKKRLRLK